MSLSTSKQPSACMPISRGVDNHHQCSQARHANGLGCPDEKQNAINQGKPFLRRQASACMRKYAPDRDSKDKDIRILHQECDQLADLTALSLQTHNIHDDISIYIIGNSKLSTSLHVSAAQNMDASTLIATTSNGSKLNTSHRHTHTHTHTHTHRLACMHAAAR